MKLRENLSTLPFSRSTPLSAFYPLSTAIFNPPFQSILVKSNPPLGMEGVRVMPEVKYTLPITMLTRTCSYKADGYCVTVMSIA